jgi:hypothetical protein
VSATVTEDTTASSKTVKVALAKAGDALLCYSGKQIISQLILPHVSDINKPTGEKLEVDTFNTCHWHSHVLNTPAAANQSYTTYGCASPDVTVVRSTS